MVAGLGAMLAAASAYECFMLISKGYKNRATGSTQCNDISSR